MDHSRLSTGDVLAAGILYRRPPATDIPQDRDTFDPEDDDTYRFVGTDAVVDALERGELVQSLNYYGIPASWKAADGVYRCVLLQYRNVTEDVTFGSAAEAAEWMREMYHSTDG